MTFNKILIANRGEIACRIIQTAKALNLQTVAIYSSADVNAKHVQLADEAYYLGASPSSESYLCMDKILAIAKRANAQAIHPGYGFLSENTDFAHACENAGVTFIGPPASAIQQMGAKAMAKTIMAKAKVPVIPGYYGADQDPAVLETEANKIGYPLLIKASYGGGGKGMRIVHTKTEFVDALAACQREAQASFGNNTVILEKYIKNPRHIEVQIFCDTHGNGVYLFERDCSIQRRHQKVLEEAPGPNISDKLRKKLGETAVQAAKAIGYVNAGTIEFLMDEKQNFYFMEMNTRLQVEHPVTEKITGEDLVAWQIDIAQGKPLPVTQQQLAIDGHAIEVRIYAEDPLQDFLPATGCIAALAEPQTSDHVRIDSGIKVGDQISIHYDPMLAKLIVWDADRATTLKRLQQALSDYQIAGTTTNLPFLRHLITTLLTYEQTVSTHFIEENQQLLHFSQIDLKTQACLASIYYYLAQQQASLPGTSTTSSESQLVNPWQNQSNWRLNHHASHYVTWIAKDSTYKTILAQHEDGLHITISGNEQSLVTNYHLSENHLNAQINGKNYQAKCLYCNEQLLLSIQGFDYQLILDTGTKPTIQDASKTGQLTAPMPGILRKIHVTEQQLVKMQQPLFILEAMKMEHTITSPCDGLIDKLFFELGETVQEGATLLAFKKE